MDNQRTAASFKRLGNEATTLYHDLFDDIQINQHPVPVAMPTFQVRLFLAQALANQYSLAVTFLDLTGQPVTQIGILIKDYHGRYVLQTPQPGLTVLICPEQVHYVSRLLAR
ncbi:hypothetical protein [Levilactobacillus bambusae]|uniref:Uncharacterized protein n=1 Tax=Levilactobacillus bambusae TaxID=2024736 RepID=A0A2V1N130_9LACO|nr:hypothetical protein [Levilactobacillus bambusae]PWG00924.1 hypothetical protein DCM90_01745 [Levilactobacillus bambusae]